MKAQDHFMPCVERKGLYIFAEEFKRGESVGEGLVRVKLVESLADGRLRSRHL